MALKNNPFYLLKVSCSAGRREIISASDELTFLLDSDVCLAAQNELINLSKRLAAEINWFIDADNSTLDRIRVNIENDEPISTDGLSALSRLNAILHNFSLQNADDSFELGYSILEINENYAVLDAEEITAAVNQRRNEAKLGTVQVSDVAAELGKKREEIRQLITEKLSALDQTTYVELVTMLAEKCVSGDEYSDGVVLSDVVDQYEVRMQSTLEEKTSAIEKHIDKIRIATHTDLIPGEINSLISEVKEWDKLAQPLQLKSQASGMPHEMSERLGSKIRNLSLFLHNEKTMTKEALALVNAMKSVFAELGVLSDKFETDSGTLKDLLKDQTVVKEINDELDALHKESLSIKTYSSQTIIAEYIAHIKKLNQRIKFMELDDATKTKIRENICLIGRDTSLYLNNEKHQTEYAFKITSALVDEFLDLSSLTNILYVDINALSDLLARSGKDPMKLLHDNQSYSETPSNVQNNKKSSKSNKGCLVVVLIIIAICIAVVVAGRNANTRSSSSSSYNRSSSSSSSRSSSSTSSTSTNTTSSSLFTKPATNNEKSYSSSSDVGDNVYVNIVLIEPEYGVYMSEVGKAVKSFTKYDDYVCKCTTETGNKVWVSFDANSYRSKIDSTVDIYVSTTSSGFGGERVRYSPAAKLHGKVVRASSVMSGLDTKIGQSSIIEFSSIDIPTQTINTTKTVTIKSIFPSYTITSGSSNKVTHVLCEYSDTSGKKDWIYMSVSDYKKYFDSSANPATDKYSKEKKFSISKVVQVTTEYADDLISGASGTIGKKTLYVLSGTK